MCSTRWRVTTTRRSKPTVNWSANIRPDRAGQNNLAVVYFNTLNFAKAHEHGQLAIAIYPEELQVQGELRALCDVRRGLRDGGDHRAEVDRGGPDRSKRRTCRWRWRRWPRAIWRARGPLTSRGRKRRQLKATSTRRRCRLPRSDSPTLRCIKACMTTPSLRCQVRSSATPLNRTRLAQCPSCLRWLKPTQRRAVGREPGRDRSGAQARDRR